MLTTGDLQVGVLTRASEGGGIPMSIWRHMYISRVAVYRMGGGAFVDGAPTFGYEKLTDIVDWQLGAPGEMLCRIDLQWERPGKRQPMATEAGVKPSRTGTLF